MDLSVSLPPGAEPATDVVSQKVFINGSVLSDEVTLSQIIVNKSFNKISLAKVVFLDGSASDQDFPLSDDDKFKPGSTIKIQLGYHGEVDTVFEGIIIKHAVKVRQHGASLLMIEAKDKAIALTQGRKSKYFINKNDKDAIEEIATDYSPDVEDTGPAHKQLVQFDATDWDFIVTRAEANGMMVLTDDGKIIIKTPVTDSSPVLEAIYGKNIIEFEAEMDARRQWSKVLSHAWDFNEQKLIDSDPGNADFSETGNISASDLGKVIDATVDLNHSGYIIKKQLGFWADAYELRKKLSQAVGRVRIEGKANIKPGNMITLSGVGDRFSGDVFVTGVLHQFEGYWQTDIQFGWRDEWFYKKEDVMNRPATGLLPGVNGLQIGSVLDVDDTEDGQYRVKVHIPLITSGNKGIWARVATLDAGKNRGVYFRPQKGDEVVLGFLNDDPRDAIILGCMHSKKNHPSPLPAQGEKLQYGIVTDKTKLVFDDNKSTITLSIKDGTKEKSITVNNDSGAMELKDENSNSIKMDSSGITIQAGPTQNVIIKGLQVMINS